MRAPALQAARPKRAPRIGVALRAACELVATSAEPGGSASVTMAIGRDPGQALVLLRRIEDLADEFGLRQRVELHGGEATVHVWRD